DLVLRVVEHGEQLGDGVEQATGPRSPEQDGGATGVLARDLPEGGLAHLRAQVGGAAGRVLVGGDRAGAGGQRGGPGPQPEGGEQVAAGQGKVVHDGAPSVVLWWCGGQGSRWAEAPTGASALQRPGGQAADDAPLGEEEDGQHRQ